MLGCCACVVWRQSMPLAFPLDSSEKSILCRKGQGLYLPVREGWVSRSCAPRQPHPGWKERKSIYVVGKGLWSLCTGGRPG